MAKKQQGASVKEQYGAYAQKGRWAQNKKRKLERHLKKYPNDEQAKKALGNVGGAPTRKPPQAKLWKSPQIVMAELFASVGINGHHALGSDRISAKINDGENLRYSETEGRKKKTNSRSAN